MGIFARFRRNIGRGVEQYRATAGAVLLDVRMPQEYRDGHIHGSVNVPLQSMERVAAVVGDREAPLYVCCCSGTRSRVAARILRRIGYARVTDIGGISAYSSRIER